MALIKQAPPVRTRAASAGRQSKFTAEDQAALLADAGEWYIIDGYNGTQVPANLKKLVGFEFITRAVDNTESGRALFGRALTQEQIDELNGDDIDAAYGLVDDDAPDFDQE